MWFWFFILSVCLNIFFLLYVRWLLNTVKFINQDINNLSDILKDFSKHISDIYELEMFYGDETLKSLLNHAKEVSSIIDDLDLVLNEDEQEEGIVMEEIYETKEK